VKKNIKKMHLDSKKMINSPAEILKHGLNIFIDRLSGEKRKKNIYFSYYGECFITSINLGKKYFFIFEGYKNFYFVMCKNKKYKKNFQEQKRKS
jgi:hypothetical protein